MGTSAVIPGTIEAEAFDYGGEGVGYHDTTAGNSGGVRSAPFGGRRLMLMRQSLGGTVRAAIDGSVTRIDGL